MITIGERIKELRQKKKISQAALAKNINVSAGNVGDWERGKAKPGADALVSLMNYFSVSADWLLTGNVSKDEINNVMPDNKINDTRKSIDSNILSLTEEERKLVLSFRNFDDFDKELIKDTFNNLMKRLEKSSTSDFYTSGDEEAATRHA